MSQTQHTPGPWTHYADIPSTDPNWHIVTNASKMRVVANVHLEPGNATDAANAALIAAAPDLLAALTLAESSFDTYAKTGAFTAGQPSTWMLNTIRAAIAKAKGEDRQPTPPTCPKCRFCGKDRHPYRECGEKFVRGD